MIKKIAIKLSFVLVLILGFSVFSQQASASVHISNYSGTTVESTTHHYKNEHAFYSSSDTINVEFKVNEFIKTHKNKRVYIEVQKDKGLWWSTLETKSVTNTTKINFNVNGGTGTYRILVYDAAESTGYDKPPLYYAKSSSYSGKVTGL